MAFVLMVLVLMSAKGAMAQSVLFQGAAGGVTEEDVTADAATRFSDVARATMLSRPGNVQQLAANLYVQRAMAIEAERKGLARSKEAESILRLAREKALADLYWADFEKSRQPDDAALEAYAQSTYRAASESTLQAPERARVRHILLKEKTPENRVRMEGWLKQAQDGAEFSKLARDHSEDQGSASRGGDIGFVAEGATVPLFEDAVKALQNPGDLSPVIETEFGYHIIRLEERRPAGKRGFEEVRDQLLLSARAMLLRELRSQEVLRLQEGGQPDQAAIGIYSSQFTPAEGAR